MIYQDFWLTQDGMLEQSASEHAKYVRRVMLQLDEFYPMPRPFDAITKAEAREAAKRGVSKKIIAFLAKGSDPRKWALKEYGWVRTAQNHINLWELNDETLGLLRTWVRALNMDPNETFDLEELATGNEITVSARQLRNFGTTPAALKAYGAGVGRYRNPVMDQDRMDAYPGQQMFQFAPDKEDYPDLAQTPWFSLTDAVESFFTDRYIPLNTRERIDAVTVLQRTIEKHWGFGAMKWLGRGSFATAFYTPAQTVLKLTLDWDDVRACAVVERSPGENLVQVHASGVSQAAVYWREGEQIGVAGAVSRIGLIETAYVPFDFEAGFFENDGYKVKSWIGQAVANIKNKYQVWPDDIRKMRKADAISTLREAQQDFIMLLKRLVVAAQLEWQGQIEDVLRGVRELADRGIYTVDIHAENARWTGDRMLLTDFGVGKLRWELYKQRTKVFRKNPSENNVVLIDSDIQPDELDY
jgi:hypothetical protein